jgi:hypothetical protein
MVSSRGRAFRPRDLLFAFAGAPPSFFEGGFVCVLCLPRRARPGAEPGLRRGPRLLALGRRKRPRNRTRAASGDFGGTGILPVHVSVAPASSQASLRRALNPRPLSSRGSPRDPLLLFPALTSWGPLVESLWQLDGFVDRGFLWWAHRIQSRR